MAATGLETAVVTPQRWDDLARLFEEPGPRGGRPDTANCWCVIWRARAGSAEDNRRTLCELVEAGEEPGLLAYRDGEPVGWVSVAPRERFPGLLRSPQFGPEDDEPDVFVITCFAVARRQRRAGIATALLDSAVEHAVARGARAVEAFPGDPYDYKGGLAWFLDYGFLPVREIGRRTHVRYVPA